MATESGSGIGALVAAFGAIVGLAMVAVLVSQRAQTSSIIQALASGTGSVIGAATAPVTTAGQSNTGVTGG
jgi:hypothetical protein